MVSFRNTKLDGYIKFLNKYFLKWTNRNMFQKLETKSKI